MRACIYVHSAWCEAGVEITCQGSESNTDEVVPLALQGAGLSLRPGCSPVDFRDISVMQGKENGVFGLHL